MAKLTQEQAEKQNSALLKKEGFLFITEDGAAFYGTEQGKAFAYSHANTQKPALKVFECKSAQKKPTTSKKKK